MSTTKKWPVAHCCTKIVYNDTAQRYKQSCCQHLLMPAYTTIPSLYLVQVGGNEHKVDYQLRCSPVPLELRSRCLIPGVNAQCCKVHQHRDRFIMVPHSIMAVCLGASTPGCVLAVRRTSEGKLPTWGLANTFASNTRGLGHDGLMPACGFAHACNGRACRQIEAVNTTVLPRDTLRQFHGRVRLSREKGKMDPTPCTLHY